VHFIYTIGYEGASLAALLHALEENSIERVIDVRYAAISRRPEFSKGPLRRALRARGITYLHMPELGCPKDIRSRYRENGDFAWYSRRYTEQVLSRRQRQLTEVARDARIQRVCLLCVEADAHRCHRSLLAASSAEINRNVFGFRHLRRGGAAD